MSRLLTCIFGICIFISIRYRWWVNSG